MGWITALFCFEAIMILLMVGSRKTQYIENCNETFFCYSKTVVFLIVMAMIIVSAFRNSFIDTEDYRLMYYSVGRNFNNIFVGYLKDVEKGYLFFTYLLNQISSNSQFLLIVTSIITISLNIKCIYNLSVDAAISIWVFFCVDFITTMNGIRQVMVCAIVVIVWFKLSTSEKRIRNDLLFIICLLILSTIHRSVLICIPIMLLTRGRFFNRFTQFLIIGTILMFAIPSIYHAVLENVLGGGNYAEYINITQSMSIGRLAVNSVPVILIMLARMKGIEWEEEDCLVQWMLNMCVFAFCCNILALRMVYFGRLAMYFNVFVFILLPLLIQKTFAGRAPTVKGFAYVLYGIYYFLQCQAYGGYLTNFSLVI